MSISPTRLIDQAQRSWSPGDFKTALLPLSPSLSIVPKSRDWFAADASQPLMCFAGLWTNWTSVRKAKEGEVTADVFGFLTITPNAEVAKVHPQAMSAILTTSDECDLSMNGDWEKASKLQRPLPDGSLKTVARGEKEDVG